MDSSNLIIIVGVTMFNLVILYLVIATATKAQARYKIEWAQMKLLAEIARKQGVDENLINEVVANSQ